MRARKNAAGLWTYRFTTPPNAAGQKTRLYVKCPREQNTRETLDLLVRQAVDRHLRGVATSRLSFAEFFETIFLPEYPASKDLATSSVRAYTYLVGDIACQYIGSQPIGDIDTGVVARLVKRLREQDQIDAAVSKEEGRRARALQIQGQAPSKSKANGGLTLSPAASVDAPPEQGGGAARARALQNESQGLSVATIFSASKVLNAVLSWAAATAVPPTRRFGAAAEQYLAARAAELKPASRRQYTYQIRNHLVPYLSDTPIGKITTATIADLCRRLAAQGRIAKQKGYRAVFVAGAYKKDGSLKKPWEVARDRRRGGTTGERPRFSPQTIRNLVVGIKAVLSYAKTRGHITTMPDVAIPKVPKARTSAPYTRDEARQLIQAAATEQRRVMYVLSYDAGCRKSELLGLEWEQVIWERHVIKFDRQRYRGVLKHCKGGKEREVPMSPPLEKALKKMWLACEDKKGPVFCQENGKPLEEHHVRIFHERDTEKAGLRKVRWHSKRHTFSTQATERGVSPWGLQLLLGHADIRTTQTYVHVSAERMPSVLDDEGTP